MPSILFLSPSLYLFSFPACLNQTSHCCLSCVIDYASCSLCKGSPKVFKQGSLLRPCTGHSQAPEESACAWERNWRQLSYALIAYFALRIRRVVHQLRVKDVSKLLNIRSYLIIDN